MPHHSLVLVSIGASSPNSGPIGWSDLPPDPAAISSAESLAKELQSHGVVFDRAFCAPSKRAVRTADALLSGSASDYINLEKISGLLDRHAGLLAPPFTTLPPTPPLPAQPADQLLAASASLDATPAPVVADSDLHPSRQRMFVHLKEMCKGTSHALPQFSARSESLQDTFHRVQHCWVSEIRPALLASTHGVMVVCDPVVLRILSVCAGATSIDSLTPKPPAMSAFNEVAAAVAKAAGPGDGVGRLSKVRATADGVAAFFVEYGHMPNGTASDHIEAVCTGRAPVSAVVYAIDTAQYAAGGVVGVPQANKPSVFKDPVPGAVTRMPLDPHSAPLVTKGSAFVDAEMGGTLFGASEYENGLWLLEHAREVIEAGQRWKAKLDASLAAAGGESVLRDAARGGNATVAVDAARRHDVGAVAGGWFTPKHESAQWLPELRSLFTESRGSAAVYHHPVELVARFARICRHDAERIWQSPRMREVHCRALLGLAPADPHSAGEKRSRSVVSSTTPYAFDGGAIYDSTVDGTMGPAPVGSSFVLRTGNYFQPASFVLALLRLALPLSDSIRCHSTIATLDKYLPGHYVEESAGNHVDCLIAVDLAHAGAPDVAQHLFGELAYPYQAFMPKWFSALCVPLLPFNLQLKYMDAFCEHGVVFLYRFVIAVFQVLRERLLACTSAAGASPLLAFRPTVVTQADLSAIVEAAVENTTLVLEPADLLARRRKAFEEKVRSMLERSRQIHDNHSESEGESERTSDDDDDVDECVGCGGAPSVRCEVRYAN